MIQFGVESLVRIQLSAVAEQVTHRDLLLMLSQPGPYGLAVMAANVIQNQEHLA